MFSDIKLDVDLRCISSAKVDFFFGGGRGMEHDIFVQCIELE